MSRVARFHRLIAALLAGVACASAAASPFADPGDLRLRHDLQRLADGRHLNLPLTTWPLSWADIGQALDSVSPEALDNAALVAYLRVREAYSEARAMSGPAWRAGLEVAGNPRLVRSFANTPRDDGRAIASVSGFAGRVAYQLTGSLVADPADGDEVRPDGSFAGLSLGNWVLSAGWQERWWGPGRDGSLILSTNARPVPAIAMQRLRSDPFESRWLSWIGPWTAVAFLGRLDDDRAVPDTLLFGMRVSVRPVQSLEIGFSRTAQWCGDGRPCNASTFADLLLGKDNRGINVDPDAEPGNQLGGFDFRWALPQVPVAVYGQWIGEDTRRGGPEIGSWLRQAGLEFHGGNDSLLYRTHFEVAETTCRDGGLGFSEAVADCAYEHSIYRTGYRYLGRSLGHGVDGDGLAYSAGATLVQSAGHTWGVSVRRLEINRAGQPSATHSLSTTARDEEDLLISYSRQNSWGALHFGAGYRRADDAGSGDSSNELTGYLSWSSR